MQTATKFVLVALMTSSAVTAKQLPSNNSLDFSEWQEKHGKHCDTPEECQARKQIFEENLKHLEEMRKLVPDMQFDLDETLDMTQEEWAIYRDENGPLNRQPITMFKKDITLFAASAIIATSSNATKLGASNDHHHHDHQKEI